MPLNKHGLEVLGIVLQQQIKEYRSDPSVYDLNTNTIRALALIYSKLDRGVYFYTGLWSSTIDIPSSLIPDSSANFHIIHSCVARKYGVNSLIYIDGYIRSTYCALTPHKFIKIDFCDQPDKSFIDAILSLFGGRFHFFGAVGIFGLVFGFMITGPLVQQYT